MAKGSKRLTVCLTTDRTTESVHWVIHGELAYIERPGSGLPIVPAKTVDRWLEQIRQLGVKSLIVMLTEDEMTMYYPNLGQPLIDYYRGAGFKVRNVTTQDNGSNVSLRVLGDRAFAAFKALPKPVLVHCNAGLERSKFVVRAILENLPSDKSTASGTNVRDHF